MNKREQHKIAVRLVSEYISTLKKPKWLIRKEEFESRSYAITAANEILDLLYYNPGMDPIDLIEGGVLPDWLRYARSSSHHWLRFMTFAEVAEDVLDLFYAAFTR